MTTIIPSVALSTKNPGFFGETLFGQGAVSAGDQRLKLLCVGLKDTAATGTATLDTEVFQVPDAETADTKAGAGSELNRMLIAALRIPGVDLYGLAVTPNGGAVAGDATLTVGGTWSAAGVIRLWIGGELHEANVGAADTTSDVATSIKNAINANARGVCKATSLVAVATVTNKSAGARANHTIVFKDLSGAPPGLTLAIAGGTSVPGDDTTGPGARLTNGAGVETMTTALATLSTTRYHRIAFAQDDATSVAAWEAHIDAMAGPTINKTQHAIFGFNSNALSTAQSVAQTTANDARMQCLWMKDGESHPSEMAAVFAAARTLYEQDNPNSAYDSFVLPGIKGQRYKPSRLSFATVTSALDNSVTPCDTQDNGDVYIVRSITTRSQNDAGTVSNWNVLDTSESVVPDYVRDDLALDWLTSFSVANPHVRNDAPEEEATPPAGVATPKLWNDRIIEKLREYERDLLITGVSAHLPATTFNPEGSGGTGWLESVVPLETLTHQHAAKVSVRQQRGQQRV